MSNFEEIDDQDEEESKGEPLRNLDDEDDGEEPGDVHVPCPSPSTTIGREIVDEEPFPEGIEDEDAGDPEASE